MTEDLDLWRCALRRLILRSSGRLLEYSPVTPPPDLEPPETLRPIDNGYLALAAHVSGIPEQGPYGPDLNHRRKALPSDRQAADRALASLRPYLEGIDSFLNAPSWQVSMPESGEWPELAKIRRLGQALLLRGAVDGCSEDRERVVLLARRLRRSEGVFIHLLVGIALERLAEGPLSGLANDRSEAVRMELARYTIPRVHLTGPWAPLSRPLPPAWADARRATQWLLAEHPNPYDPQDTVAALALAWPQMAEGSPEILRRGVDELATPWPAGMRDPESVGPGHSSLSELRATRPLLNAIPNPYGRLAVAHTLRAAAHVAEAVEKVGS